MFALEFLFIRECLPLIQNETIRNEFDNKNATKDRSINQILNGHTQWFNGCIHTRNIIVIVCSIYISCYQLFCRFRFWFISPHPFLSCHHFNKIFSFNVFVVLVQKLKQIQHNSLEYIYTTNILWCWSYHFETEEIKKRMSISFFYVLLNRFKYFSGLWVKWMNSFEIDVFFRFIFVHFL